MPKIVFIINSISSQRCIKRVEEFIAHGYAVEVYGFSRKMEMYSKPKHFSIEVIGEFDNSMSFIKRIPILRKGIRKVLQKYRYDKDVVYYLFQLDVALVFKMIDRGNRYIYEESDLAHTYIANNIVRRILEFVDKQIIRKSLLTVFTSEGFLMYHYGKSVPTNVCIIANRLTPLVETMEKVAKRSSEGKLKIGFVGVPRFKSVVNFARTFCSNFPDYEFHIYGEVKGVQEGNFSVLRKFSNCFFHGAFRNPDDLPVIYSNLDLVLSTYDVEYENVRYAEPNKMYESIYFETPIIVSHGTFLEKKVKELGIGYCVDPMNEQAIVELVNEITCESLQSKIQCCKAIDKRKCLNLNEGFFAKLEQLLPA